MCDGERCFRHRRPIMQKSIGAVVVIAILLAGGAYWYLHRTPEAAVPAAAPPPPSPVAQRPPDAPLPPLPDSDARVRATLSPLSKWPQLQQWLAGSDLLNTWVVIADNLAEDASPRKSLTALAPAGKFSEVGGH